MRSRSITITNYQFVADALFAVECQSSSTSIADADEEIFHPSDVTAHRDPSIVGSWLSVKARSRKLTFLILSPIMRRRKLLSAPTAQVTTSGAFNVSRKHPRELLLTSKHWKKLTYKKSWIQWITENRSCPARLIKHLNLISIIFHSIFLLPDALGGWRGNILSRRAMLSYQLHSLPTPFHACEPFFRFLPPSRTVAQGSGRKYKSRRAHQTKIVVVKGSEAAGKKCKKKTLR